MCGRFTKDYTWEQVYEFLSIIPVKESKSNLEPNYNVCPTQTIDAIVATEGRAEIVPMRWGLVPSWWKKTLKELPATFNARAETVAEKPMFRSAFKRNRCIIPASGYYEWHTEPDGKQPHYFTRRDGKVIGIAGLWDRWKDVETGNAISSCTMIITSANNFVSRLHDRMPVILEPYQVAEWLSAKAGTEALQPAGETVLQEHPVSRRVNSSRTDGSDPTLIEPID